MIAFALTAQFPLTSENDDRLQQPPGLGHQKADCDALWLGSPFSFAYRLPSVT
jgi:hypothetical protein